MEGQIMVLEGLGQEPGAVSVPVRATPTVVITQRELLIAKGSLVVGLVLFVLSLRRK
jgi:hypothetical protein